MLALHELTEKADCVLPIDNQVLNVVYVLCNSTHTHTHRAQVCGVRVYVMSVAVSDRYITESTESLSQQGGKRS